MLGVRRMSGAEAECPIVSQLPDSMTDLLRRRLASWYAARRDAVADLPKPPAHADARPAAAQVEALRLRAHTDPVTGLPNRRHFLGRLAGVLGQGAAPECSLLLLRALNLGPLGLRLGDDPLERRLALVAEALDAYPRRVHGAFAGRLNETDFALCLPAAGVADETARTLLQALRATPAAGPGGIEIVIGAADGLRSGESGDAMAAAGLALAQAEAAGPFSIEIHAAGDGVQGEQVWRDRIAEALHDGRARLAEFPVCDRHGQVLHLECPLRLQLEAGGPFREAQRWLAMASRSRLLPRVDLSAIELALLACSRDGRARCVHVGAASLGTPGFIAEVEQRLLAEPEAARRLLIDVGDGVWLERALSRLGEAARAWRAAGVRVGVEHAGASTQAFVRWAELGLDHVRIEACFVRGSAADAAVREFAAGLAALAHAMGLSLVAEGVDDAADLRTLFDLGFDAATGPAVRTAGRAAG